MNISFNNIYLEMLYEFMTKNDVRYYLNGFHVKPHSETGIILTATDGHRLVTIYDKDGFSDGEYIFPITKSLLSAAKKKLLSKGLPLNNVTIINGKALVTAICHDSFPVNENILDSGNGVTYIEFISQIDGKFPDIGNLFSRMGEPKPVSNIALNTRYLSALNKIVDSRFTLASLHLYGPNDSVVAVAGMDKNIVAVIMPGRIGDEFVPVPSFVLQAGKTRPPEALEVAA
ncbi:MAG: hypothetical protein ACJA2G_002681 [Cognaticolwellia sp.]|jgi:hypothetical protein